MKNHKLDFRYLSIPSSKFLKTTLLSGVLASLVLFFSTVASEQRDLNATSDDFNHTFTSQEEIDSVRIMDLPFAQSLRNPCSWDGSYNGPRQITFMGPRKKFIEEFFTYVSQYSKVYKEDVQAMLRNHTIVGCADLHVDSLTGTPTLEELKEMEMENALKRIYLSLLVHSAYSFIVHYQVNSTDVRCSHDIQGEQSLAKETYTMALKQKALACYVLVGMSALGYEKDDITPILNVKVSDLSLCSRRALRDCHVLNSAQKFLQELQIYTSRNIKPTNSLNSVSSTVSTVPISFVSTSATTISTTAFTSSISTSSNTIASTRSPPMSTSSIISTLLTTTSSNWTSD